MSVNNLDFTIQFDVSTQSTLNLSSLKRCAKQKKPASPNFDKKKYILRAFHSQPSPPTFISQVNTAASKWICFSSESSRII